MTKTKAPAVPTAAGALALLKEEPAGRALLVRNLVEDGAVCLSSGGADQDIVIGRGEEQVVQASWAKTSRSLRHAINKGRVTVAWVDEAHDPKVLVTPDDAPVDLTASLNATQKLFAADKIAMEADEDKAIAMVRTQVHQPEPRDRIVDARYMRDSFYQILQLADWLEERIYDRPKVRAAIKAALRDIRDL